jgi:hypothetical protein
MTFLPLLRVPGPYNSSTLDFAKFLKKSSDVYKQAYSETSDEEIIEKSTGNSKDANPENTTIVKKYSGYKPTDEDSTDVPVLVRRTDLGDTLRIQRRHKGTKHGRFISEPYFKPFK